MKGPPAIPTASAREEPGQQEHPCHQPARPSSSVNGEDNTESLDPQAPTLLVPPTYLHATGYVRAYPRSLHVESYRVMTGIEPHRIGRRGACTQFSRKSRFALLKTFSRVDYSGMSTAWWVTLTYHNRCPAGKPQLEADREAWLERIRRRFPALQYIRRLEFQKRGIPHHHYLLWSFQGDQRFEDARTGNWLNRMWHEIAEPESKDHAEYGAKSRPATTYRQLMSYISKYAAKVSDDNDGYYVGRRWSTSYHLPTRPGIQGDIDDTELWRLKKIIRRLMRKRGATQAMVYNLCKSHTDAFALLREGEPERILRMARLIPSPPPKENPHDNPA